jgi:thioredoxin-related protein
VDGIEREFEGRLTVIRMNVQESAGQALGRLFDFKYTPTFIFFDEKGEELWRTIGAIDPQDVRRSLEEE